MARSRQAPPVTLIPTWSPTTRSCLPELTGVVTGDGVRYEIGATPAEVAKGVSLSGLSGDTGANEYYVIRISATEIQLAKSEIDTRTGTIVLNTAGLANRRSHRLVSATAAESPSDTGRHSIRRSVPMSTTPQTRSPSRTFRRAACSQTATPFATTPAAAPRSAAYKGRHVRRRQRLGQHVPTRGIRRGEEPEHRCPRRHHRSRSDARSAGHRSLAATVEAVATTQPARADRDARARQGRDA